MGLEIGSVRMLKPRLTRLVNAALGLVDLRLVSARTEDSTVAGSDDPTFRSLYGKCRPFTRTSIERMYAAYQATNYVVDCGLPGALVECGVWKGGSSMIMALTLLERGVRDRDIYLYDTFKGMTEPGERDVNAAGEDARPIWQQRQRDGVNTWAYSPLAEVQENFVRTGYPMDKVHLVEGKVEQTIPSQMPEAIALLRLDTDWYESTLHELTHMYPRLARGGALIIDDYGSWRGAREATDEYFRQRRTPVLLNRIDYTGRLIVKVD